MVTPLEDEVLESFLASLQAEGISGIIVDGLRNSFLDTTLPTAESMIDLIKAESGDRIA